MKFEQDLMIDGLIEGNISSANGVLTIGENGVIKGEIRTRSAVVFGKVEGNLIVGELCDLRATSVFSGDVMAGKLAMEEGAVFMGSWKVGPKG
jgi:cytoskeletal protein CcmA (bactofilin family)